MSSSRPVLAAVFLLSLASAKLALATERAECLSIQSGILRRPVPYCVLLPPSYDSQKTRRYPVLYLLHGLGGDEQMLVRSGGFNLVGELWEEGRVGEFLIVTPRGDSSFYINSRDGRRRYEDFFLQEFLPSIERRYRLLPGRKYRGIEGVSMGGYGALHIAFRHPELFVAVSAHSAALMERLPRITVADPRQSPLLAILGGVFGSPPDDVFWDRNNPLTLARSIPSKTLLIYFDCGAQDDYGFQAGAQSLHAILESRGVAHEFHIYPGGHDWLYFAGHLPASLQFHSRAFGLPSTQK